METVRTLFFSGLLFELLTTMPGAFLLTGAPSGSSWEEALRASPPALDGNGYVCGPWGECMHYAVVYEIQNPSWQEDPQYTEEGPAGQVAAFAAEVGFAGFQDALMKTEEATKENQDNGNEGFVFQSPQQFSQPQPMMMGAPQGFSPQGVPMQQVMAAPMTTMNVQVPDGVFAGQMITVASPDGQQVQVQVPQGVNPGDTFQVQIPGAVVGTVLTPVDPFQMLGSLQGIKIEEKMNLLETASGLLGELMGVDMELEMSNKYLITSPEGHPLFFAMETTDFCNRQCGGDCRAIDIDVVVLGQDEKLLKEATGDYDWSMNPFKKPVDLTNSQKFLKLHKDCQCTCCCFNRPKIDVINAITNERIGQITDPWACCDMTFNLLDKTEQPALTAKGACCQMGLICPCPCGPCREVKFDVKDAKTQQDVGSFKKVVPDCLKFIVADDVDNYEIEFGQVSDPEWKAMLVALGLFVDFRYFNTRSDKNDNVAGGFGDGDGDGDGGD